MFWDTLLQLEQYGNPAVADYSRAKDFRPFIRRTGPAGAIR